MNTIQTLGVKVDRKTVAVPGGVVTMLLWDIHGETEGLSVPESYLRGATAALLVFDASRPETIETAASLGQKVRQASPKAVQLAVANKADLDIDWALVDPAAQALDVGMRLRSSAKTGDGVADAFAHLARAVANP